MSFSITTTVSHNYLPLSQFCLPSWHRNSGAEHIDVRYHPGSGNRHSLDWWFENLTFRCRTILDSVRQAVMHRRRLLLLDLDCLILSDLSSGFSNDKPFAVTHWPEINMGVMFLNTSLPWPFVAFFEEFLERATINCKAMIDQKLPGRAGDQDVMWAMLAERESEVCKLAPSQEWNFKYSPRSNARDRLEQMKSAIRILHIRFKSFAFNLNKIEHLRQDFPAAF